VHGNSYGTPKQDFFDKIEQGIDIILEIDVQGALNVQTCFPEAILMFILPSSPDVLRKRLVKRGKESAEVIERRLETAKAEVGRIKGYQYLVVNDELETAIEEVVAIVIANRCRLEYRSALAEKWQEVVKAGL
jgi:guanylate kinase